MYAKHLWSVVNTAQQHYFVIIVIIIHTFLYRCKVVTSETMEGKDNGVHSVDQIFPLITQDSTTSNTGTQQLVTTGFSQAKSCHTRC